MTLSNRQAIRRSGSMTSGQLSGLGMLNPEHAERFITFMTDDAALLPRVTVRRMKEQTMQLDYFNLENRKLRKATERTAPVVSGNLGTFTRKELVAVEAILPADISFNFIEDNLEKDGGEDLVVREIARLVGNDTEDLGLHGDTSLAETITDVGVDGLDDTTGLTQADHDFLRINDGFFKKARGASDSAKYALNVAPTDKADYKDVIFPGMLGLLPEKYKRKVDDLAYFVSPTVEENYRASLQGRNTGLGDKALTQNFAEQFMGIPVVKIPYLTDVRDMMLTNPKNLVYGIYRQIRVGRFVNERARQVEYTVTLRTDYEIVNDNLMVVTTHT